MGEAVIHAQNRPSHRMLVALRLAFPEQGIGIASCSPKSIEVEIDVVQRIFVVFVLLMSQDSLGRLSLCATILTFLD